MVMRPQAGLAVYRLRVVGNDKSVSISRVFRYVNRPTTLCTPSKTQRSAGAPKTC